MQSLPVDDYPESGGSIQKYEFLMRNNQPWARKKKTAWLSNEILVVQ